MWWRPDLERLSPSVTVNNRQEEACDEQWNVFLRRPGCRTTAWRKQVEAFFGTARHKGRRQLTDASLLEASGAVWRRRIEFDSDAHQRLIVCLCCTERSWVKSRGCLASKRQEKEGSVCILCCFLSFLLVPIFYVGTEPSSRVVHQAYCFPWDCLIGPVSLKGEAVQFLHLLQPGSPMRWHDPKVIWLPVTLVPAFYLFFMFYAQAFFFPSSTSAVATEWRISNSLSCLQGRKKRKNMLMFSTLRSYYLSLIFHSSSSYLERLERHKKSR